MRHKVSQFFALRYLDVQARAPGKAATVRADPRHDHFPLDSQYDRH